MKKVKYLILFLVVAVFLGVKGVNAKDINLSDLNELKTYEIADFKSFLNDYQNNHLDDVYITKFLFDGVGMYKPYDLDDFIDNGNDYAVKNLELTVININNIGDYQFSGELTGGMIAVNTNNLKGNINIILNNVKLDTDSKKIPVIYVYNKDITSTDCKVTIKALQNTKNYLEGGKLKKVSLIGSELLTDYTNNYSGDNKTNYTAYTKYYGVYTSEEIKNILFATVTADREDLADGDPLYYYKASGAISSDIDLYFEGNGYLEITSKNKEGVETKGNLTFSGGTGDYVINAQDDCLNTTTSNSENAKAHNSLTIDVNSMYAIVDLEADEGDAIDSNGTLTINGGLIVALSHPGQDAGLDSENGTYINGGTVLVTGDMLDAISSDSKQKSMILSFNGNITEDTLLTLLDSKDNVVFAYKTDRKYTNLIYSDKSLSDGKYYLYQNGTINGTDSNGYYTNVSSYEKGTQLGYSSINSNIGGPGMPGRNNNSENNASASYNEFTISNTNNNFSGISTYTGTGNNSLSSTSVNNNIPVYIFIGSLCILVILLIVVIIKRNKKIKEVA